MEKLTERLEWIFDYYFVYFMYNPNKIDRYHEYMLDKWNLSIDQVKISKNYSEEEVTFNN